MCRVTWVESTVRAPRSRDNLAIGTFIGSLWLEHISLIRLLLRKKQLLQNGSMDVSTSFSERFLLHLPDNTLLTHFQPPDKDERVRRLAQGRLLDELATRMGDKASKGTDDPLKIAINACHDTSLAGMCQTLDVFDGR